MDPRAPERLAGQALVGPPLPSAEAVCERLLAVQAQDPRGARLAVRARTAGLRAADVDRALSEDRSLVVDWLCRGTLHLVRREDHAWLHAVTTPQLETRSRTRLAQEGLTPAQADRGIAAIPRVLAEHGPLTRTALRAHLDAADVPCAGQALVHLVALASRAGAVVRGPLVGAEQAFVLRDDWLGPAPAVDRGTALRELALRYLAGHPTATDRDLATWAGVGLRDARAGLRALGGLVEERPSGGLALATRSAGVGGVPPKLLGPFDPVLHGWADRTWVLGDRRDVVTTNGIFKAVVLAGGRAVGTWTAPGGVPELAPFGAPPRGATRALRAEAADVTRFLAA